MAEDKKPVDVAVVPDELPMEKELRRQEREHATAAPVSEESKPEVVRADY